MWQLKDKLLVSLGAEPVLCLLGLNQDMWAACGGSVHTVSVLTVYKAGHTRQEVHRVRLTSEASAVFSGILVLLAECSEAFSSHSQLILFYAL